jgi:hypothetical protein
MVSLEGRRLLAPKCWERALADAGAAGKVDQLCPKRGATRGVLESSLPDGELEGVGWEHWSPACGACSWEQC